MLVVVRFLWSLLHARFLLKLPFLGQWWWQLALIELDQGEVPVQISQGWRRWTEDTGSSFHLLLEVAGGKKSVWRRLLHTRSEMIPTLLLPWILLSFLHVPSMRSSNTYVIACVTWYAQSQHTWKSWEEKQSPLVLHFQFSDGHFSVNYFLPQLLNDLCLLC